MPILLSCLVVAILLSDSYLRYLAFRDSMSDEEQKNLWRNFAIFSLVDMAGYAVIFTHVGISGFAYKYSLLFGFLPWLAIFMLTVRRNIWQHVFIFGMSGIWGLIQHNWAAIIVVLFFNVEQEVILMHALTYPLLFVLFLPIERRCFTKILPPKKFFVDYGKIVAFFPIIMSFGVLVLWAQEPLIHSWQERFSRFYLPFAFFFFYRHILLTTDQLQERRYTAQNLRRMKDQLGALGEYNRLIQESRDTVAVMRHDLRHTYRLLYMMLQAGEVDAAKKYIETREKLLGRTAIKTFCRLPLINAALSICIRRAENLNIEVRHKINLPQEISVDEGDFALLISNLLENAVNACIRQPTNRRRISIAMQSVNGQFVLSVANLCDETITFDEKNYPHPSGEGHGLGIASVKNFSDKYGAYTNFSQENGVFKVTMYWRN